MSKKEVCGQGSCLWASKIFEHSKKDIWSKQGINLKLARNILEVRKLGRHLKENTYHCTNCTLLRMQAVSSCALKWPIQLTCSWCAIVWIIKHFFPLAQAYATMISRLSVTNWRFSYLNRSRTVVAVVYWFSYLMIESKFYLDHLCVSKLIMQTVLRLWLNHILLKHSRA